MFDLTLLAAPSASVVLFEVLNASAAFAFQAARLHSLVQRI